MTETLDVIPRQFIVRQTVRERFSCRACETITQPPAPFHEIARWRAGPSLLAMILWSKYVMHLPLTRQAEAFQHEGIPLEVSTMADCVGACAAALEPLTELIRAEGVTVSRLHGDDTTVPVLARGKTRTGRLWVYVRDDLPFGRTGPPCRYISIRPTGAASIRRPSQKLERHPSSRCLWRVQRALRRSARSGPDP